MTQDETNQAVARAALAHVVEGRLVGVAPCYLKSPSQGAYVFDHGWADAYRRAGGEYYPKLQVSVPFTPVTGPRFLIAPGEAPQEGVAALAAALRALRTERTSRLERDPGENGVMSEFKNTQALYFGGDMESSIALSGQVAGRIDSVRPVKDILDSIMAEYRETVSALPA